ncbi:hypothetical protein LCGC14_2747770 [marine sediment metagenome]|uniref:Uncharacterized protein n=1 Tax=marine sediment metagenome TaxID=412755 RepID=A0A0F8ZPQ7_9ZZZZ
MKKKSGANTVTQPMSQAQDKTTCGCGNVAKVGTNEGLKCYWCWIDNATRYYALYGPKGLKDEPNRK